MRKPYDFLIVTLALSFKPSTTPLEANVSEELHDKLRCPSIAGVAGALLPRPGRLAESVDGYGRGWLLAWGALP